MKNAIIMMLFIAFVSTVYNSNIYNISMHEIFPIEYYCPPNNINAQNILYDYLKDSKSIERLNKKSDVDLNLRLYSEERIEPLGNEKTINECREFIKNSPWLKNIDQYSLYKTDNYYFVIDYYISDNNEFSNKSITIVNKKFEVVAFSIQLDF